MVIVSDLYDAIFSIMHFSTLKIRKIINASSMHNDHFIMRSHSGNIINGYCDTVTKLLSHSLYALRLHKQ